MKKRIIAMVLASTLVVSLTACGSSKDGQGKDGDSKEESVSSSSGSSGKYDDSTGRVVGSDAKWDGTFVSGDLKIKCGMTVAEILEQGNYAVYTDYLPDDMSLVDEAPNMCVNPVKDDGTGELHSLGSNYLDVYEKDGDSYKKVSFDIYFVNPYHYAVPLSECIVGCVIDGEIPDKDKWDTDGDGKISVDETKAVFGIEPIISEAGGVYYPFDDFFVSFMVDDSNNVYMSDAEMYGVEGVYDEVMTGYTSQYGVIKNELKTEELDTSLDSYEMTIALNKYKLDLSYFEKINSIEREYIEDSDYTYSIEIDGTTVNGNDVKLTYRSAYASEWEPMEEIYSGSFYADTAETSDGQTIYSNYEANGITQIKNRSIILYVIVDDNTPDSVYKIQQEADEILTEA